MRRIRPLVVCATLALALLPALPGHAGSRATGPRLRVASGGVRGPITGAAAPYLRSSGYVFLKRTQQCSSLQGVSGR